MRGDLCFYVSSGSLIDRLVVWRTQPGPFVHCELDLGDQTAIGALSHGVVHHALVETPYRFATAHYTSPVALERGLAWLEQQVGASYNDVAIADYLFPRHWRFLLTERHAFDCSQLGADFVREAGVLCAASAPAPGPAAPAPPGLDTLDWLATETISPNALARACGLPR